MRVSLPDGIATGGGTTKFRDVFVEPGTNAQRLFRKNNAAAESTPWSDAPAEIGMRPTAAPATRPIRGCRGGRTQIDLDLFDVTRNVAGPLTYGFSFYKVVPQLAGNDGAPTIQRGPINAASPPAVPPRRRTRSAWRSFNVENLFPVGKENDGHDDHAGRVRRARAHDRPAVRNLLKEPDVIAVQEVAVFADGSNALTGLAAALGNYTGYIATNNDGRGIATGFLVKNGTTATRAAWIGKDVGSPWGSSRVCDLHPGRCSTARRTRSTSRRATCRSWP